jgi:hypothetical protein
MRIELYKTIIQFFNKNKLVEVEFFTPITLDVDEGVTSNLLVTVNVKTINKDGDMTATYYNENDGDDLLVRLTELNVTQMAYILDELERGRYEILKEVEND